MNNIITQLTDLVSKHVGDDHFKKIYAISMLSIGISNVEEPLHIHVFGDPESGKTDLQTRFMNVVPDQNKDIASDFSPKVLMYSNLNPGTIISINDKIVNDQIGALLNQVCDSTSWRQGRICATIVGKERVNLNFPKRCLFWMNSNKRIIDYGIREVDPNAIEGRFMIFEKKYGDTEKKNIFVRRNTTKDITDEEIEKVKNSISEIYKNPKKISCSEEMRTKIWDMSKEMGIHSIRQIGRNLTISQVFAMINNREEVAVEDVENTFVLLKEQFNLKISTSETIEIKIIELIKKELLPEEVFKTLSPEKKLLYSCKEIQNKIKDDIKSTLNYIKSEGVVGYEIIKIGANRIPTECYYILSEE
jgi:hypothetical protein